MMRRLDLARDIMVLYAFAALSCKEHASNASDAGPVVGAKGATDAGPVFGAYPGNLCEDGEFKPPESVKCAEARRDFLGSCRSRYEQLRCYVTQEPEGQAACLPPTDSRVIGLFDNRVSSVGFAVEFVIDAISPGTIPDECAALVDCCYHHIGGDSGRQRCYNLLDDPAFAACDTATDDPWQFCPKVTPPAGADADGGEPPASHKSPCCYRVCGYSHQT
jgi:hypothetical protein